MSFCRWSSDNFNCDIYAYEHVDGYYAIHVAGRRKREACKNEPHPNLFAFGFSNKGTPAEKSAALDAYRDAVDAQMEPIGLPHDGKSFSEPTFEAYKARMLELRALGYKFPDYALEDD